MPFSDLMCLLSKCLRLGQGRIWKWGDKMAAPKHQRGGYKKQGNLLKEVERIVLDWGATLPDKGISSGRYRSSPTPKPVGALGRMSAIGLGIHKEKGIKAEEKAYPLGSQSGKRRWWRVQWTWMVDDKALLGKQEFRHRSRTDWAPWLGLLLWKTWNLDEGGEDCIPGFCRWSVLSQWRRDWSSQVSLVLGWTDPLSVCSSAGCCTFRRLGQILSEILYHSTPPQGR